MSQALLRRLKNKRVVLARLDNGDWVIHTKRLSDKPREIVETVLRLSDEAMGAIVEHYALFKAGYVNDKQKVYRPRIELTVFVEKAAPERRGDMDAKEYCVKLYEEIEQSAIQRTREGIGGKINDYRKEIADTDAGGEKVNDALRYAAEIAMTAKL